MNETQSPKPEVRTADEIKREKRNRARRIARQFRDELYREMGLTKVRGAVSGRTYWE